jgi:integrase/recombinase XerD
LEVTKYQAQERLFNDILVLLNKKVKTHSQMKINGNGQAKVLTKTELERLFTEGFSLNRDRCLFAICLFTGCRISEALALNTTDLKNGTIIFRKSITKGKLKTREVVIPPTLQKFFSQYQPSFGALFPGMHGRGHLSRFMADRILKEACRRIGVEGVSTHSFRRTALTQMHNAGIPLKHIQEISGHSDLGTLQLYLEVSAEQKQKAVSVIGW